MPSILGWWASSQGHRRRERRPSRIPRIAGVVMSKSLYSGPGIAFLCISTSLRETRDLASRLVAGSSFRMLGRVFLLYCCVWRLYGTSSVPKVHVKCEIIPPRTKSTRDFPMLGHDPSLASFRATAAGRTLQGEKTKTLKFSRVHAWVRSRRAWRQSRCKRETSKQIRPNSSGRCGIDQLQARLRPVKSFSMPARGGVGIWRRAPISCVCERPSGKVSARPTTRIAALMRDCVDLFMPPVLHTSKGRQAFPTMSKIAVDVANSQAGLVGSLQPGHRCGCSVVCVSQQMVDRQMRAVI